MNGHLMSSLFPMHAALAMEAEAENKQRKAVQSANGVWQSGVPDVEITVVARMADPEYPILVGYFDGAYWVFNHDFVAPHLVNGWMHLDEAARLLDGGGL